MRKTASFKMDDKEIQVMELRVKDYRALISKFGTAEITPKMFLEEFENLLPLATNLTMADLDEMAPSEVSEVFEKFKECNSVFFDLLDKLGLGDLTGRLKEAMINDLQSAFVRPSNMVTQNALITE